MKFAPAAALPALLIFAASAHGQRINQEGRILGALPVVTNSILFDTSNADAVVSAMQIFPVTNPWNECISNRPVLANSDAMIGQIYTNVGSSHRYLKLFQEMNYVLVPDNQPLVPFSFKGGYPGDSDFNGGVSPVGLYPIPTNQPIEGWPTQLGGETLSQAQTVDDGGDRHAIMVQPGAGFIYESWRTLLSPPNWHATNGAIFNLNTNGLRPDGWTSGDAAGFPMFPALVRYDESERGMVEHACRLVVAKSRDTNIYPATHYAGSVAGTATNYPAMGQRLRLKSTFNIPAGWTTEEKALALGLKKYGAMVADNSSSFFSISITPDDRWPADAFDDINSGGLPITNFEVVLTTDVNEGPRSPGAPVANAGPDQTVPVGQPVPLQGAVVFSNSTPVIQWQIYSGPGNVTFGNAALTNTTATFSAPGIYTLELSADDGVHAVAYDAAVFTASNVVTLGVSRSGTNANFTWTGGTAPYVLQQTGTLRANPWVNVLTTSQQSASVPITNKNQFFRIQSE
ncbi:MAG TPA: hypothetical protein VK742_12055 [Candidatus Sulfotelmatobacter sp.]|jgi:hypothetical protein|nr:hypothetical protein [Candidatus Sulfotelmatobacter sp.]